MEIGLNSEKNYIILDVSDFVVKLSALMIEDYSFLSQQMSRSRKNKQSNKQNKTKQHKTTQHKAKTRTGSKHEKSLCGAQARTNIFCTTDWELLRVIMVCPCLLYTGTHWCWLQQGILFSQELLIVMISYMTVHYKCYEMQAWLITFPFTIYLLTFCNEWYLLG